MASIALTGHAKQRMEERGLTPDAIEAAMTFGASFIRGESPYLPSAGTR